MGHRVFVVNPDNSVEGISQKAFSDFFLRHEPTLVRYSGREIHVAVAFYTLKDRKPDQIFRIDSQRLTVKGDGSIDESRSNDALRLAMNRVGSTSKADATTTSENVIDATAKFDDKRWAQYHPQLPGPVIKQIIHAIFGHAA